MSPIDFNNDLPPEQKPLRDQAHRFAAEVLRPASLELDPLSPEQVIAPDSRLPDVFRESLKRPAPPPGGGGLLGPREREPRRRFGGGGRSGGEGVGVVGGGGKGGARRGWLGPAGAASRLRRHPLLRSALPA